MPKTAEELKLLKEKVAALESELKELSEDELEKVAAGYEVFGSKSGQDLHVRHPELKTVEKQKGKGAIRTWAGGYTNKPSIP